MKLRKIKNWREGIFTLHQQKRDKWKSETSGNVYLFVIISWLISFEVSTYMQYFFDLKRNEVQTMNAD